MKNILICLMSFYIVLFFGLAGGVKAISCQESSDCAHLGSVLNNKWICHKFNILGGENLKLCVKKDTIEEIQSRLYGQPTKSNTLSTESYDIIADTESGNFGLTSNNVELETNVMVEDPNEKTIRFNADIIGFDFTSVPNSISSLNATNNTLPMTLDDDEDEEEETWLEEDDYLDNAFFS